MSLALIFMLYVYTICATTVFVLMLILIKQDHRIHGNKLLTTGNILLALLIAVFGWPVALILRSCKELLD